jgi:hypothetical protein
VTTQPAMTPLRRRMLDDMKLRNNQCWFTSLAEVKRIIEAWRLDYDLHRPHTSLRMRTPAGFAAARPFAKRQQPVTAVSDAAPPPETVAAISAPMLSGGSGFS